MKCSCECFRDYYLLSYLFLILHFHGWVNTYNYFFNREIMLWILSFLTFFAIVFVFKSDFFLDHYFEAILFWEKDFFSNEQFLFCVLCLLTLPIVIRFFWNNPESNFSYFLIWDCFIATFYQISSTFEKILFLGKSLFFSVRAVCANVKCKLSKFMSF